MRLVKDGRFHHQKFFQTTFSLKAYTDFVEAVELGYGQISEEVRPRVTNLTLWFEYMIRYFAYDEGRLNTVYDVYEMARVQTFELTGYNYYLRDYNSNFNKRMKKGSLQVPKS